QRAPKARKPVQLFMDTITYASVAVLPWSFGQTNKLPIVPEVEFPSLNWSYISPIGLKESFVKPHLLEFSYSSVTNFFLAFRSSVSPNAKNDAVLPSHRTSCQNPLPSRYMILNELIEPRCQHSIFRKTASMSSVTEHLPKPVSTIEI